MRKKFGEFCPGHSYSDLEKLPKQLQSVSKYFLVPTKALSEPAALSASWAGWKPESFEREFDKSTSDESLQTRGAVLNPQK